MFDKWNQLEQAHKVIIIAAIVGAITTSLFDMFGYVGEELFSNPVDSTKNKNYFETKDGGTVIYKPGAPVIFNNNRTNKKN